MSPCIPLSIILDWCVQFTSRFLRSFNKGLGTNVKLSTAFHPQMDGQAERTIQTLEDMLRDLSFISRKIRIRICLWWSLLTTIATMHLYLWLFMKPCMVGIVDLQLGYLKWVNIHICVSI